MRISVIVPVYNVAPYLRQCMDSILTQTLTDFELICVDDGSGDGSLEILQEYAAKDSRVKVLRQQHAFAGAARNLGLEAAQGEYVQFLDSDDFYEPDLLQIEYDRLSRTGADLCAVLGRLYNDKLGRFTGEYFIKKECVPRNREAFAPADLGVDALRFMYLGPTNKLIRRKLIMDNGLRFGSTRSCNDLYFVCMVTALAKTATVYCEKPLVAYRVGISGNTQSRLPSAPTAFCEAQLQLRRGLEARQVYEKFAVAYMDVAASSLTHYVGKLQDCPEALDTVWKWLRQYGDEAFPIDVSRMYTGTLSNLLMTFDGITKDMDGEALSRQLKANAKRYGGDLNGLNPRRGAFLLRKLCAIEGPVKGGIHFFRIAGGAVLKRMKNKQ